MSVGQLIWIQKIQVITCNTGWCHLAFIIPEVMCLLKPSLQLFLFLFLIYLLYLKCILQNRGCSLLLLCSFQSSNCIMSQIIPKILCCFQMGQEQMIEKLNLRYSLYFGVIFYLASELLSAILHPNCFI